MSSRGWWTLCGVWTLGMGVFWALWFQARAQKAEAAADRARAWQTAIAAVTQTPPQKPRSDTPSIDAAALWADLTTLSFPRATDAARAKARGHIAHALLKLNIKPDLQAFAEGVNVVAERAGSDPKAGAILLGAHFDSVPGTPGADDNASGVATVLAVARALGDRPTRKALRLAFFDREEDGLLGSTRYAASDVRVADLRGVIVVEMVGFRCDTPGCQAVPPGVPPGISPRTGQHLVAVGDAEHLALLQAFRTAAAPGRTPVVPFPVVARGNDLPDTRRSDHAPFWDRGVPAVMITDTANLRNPHYHQPTDAPATLDPRFLRASAQTVLDVTWRLLEPGPTAGQVATPQPTPGSSR